VKRAERLIINNNNCPLAFVIVYFFSFGLFPCSQHSAGGCLFVLIDHYVFFYSLLFLTFVLFGLYIVCLSWVFLSLYTFLCFDLNLVLFVFNLMLFFVLIVILKFILCSLLFCVVVFVNFFKKRSKNLEK
jgi:hypothetical protein